MSYDHWKRRVAGEVIPAYLQPGPEDEGYYRKPVAFEKLPNGRTKIKAWTPVALFLDNEVLHGLIGAGPRMREMTARDLEDESGWSWIVGNAISYAEYKAVAEEGKDWSIDKPPAPEPVRVSENVSAEEPPAPAEPVTAEDHKKLIEQAKEAAKGVTVTNDAEASIAQGHCNRLAELRLAADKAGKAEYQPPFKEYKAKYAVWHPMVDIAAEEESRLTRLILTYREKERQRQAQEAIAAEELKRKQEEDAQRVADRAIANGEPPSMQELPLAEPEPAPVQEVARPAKVVASYGKRSTREELKTFAIIKDQDLVYHHFKGVEAVQILLKTLATQEIRAGRSVPGAEKKEGLIE